MDARGRKETVTVESYLAALTAAQRAALENLRDIIRAAAPEAEEYITYGVPAFRWRGKPLAGFGATASHCSFYPMSGAIVGALEAELRGFATSKGAIRFQAEKPLPPALVRRLLSARMAEIDG